MEYLNDWDKTIPNLDIVDDYASEKEEILACQGTSFPFSFGDVSGVIVTQLIFFFIFFPYFSFKYVVKILMGCVDTWFDVLDERKISLNDGGESKK